MNYIVLPQFTLFKNIRRYAIGATAAAILVGSQGMVTGLTAHAQVAVQNAEVQKIVGSINKETDRRNAQLEKAKTGVEGADSISPQAKAQVTKTLQDAQKSNSDIKTKAAGVKDAAGAQELAQSLEGQYEKYAMGQAQGSLLTDSDGQQESVNQLSGAAANVQSMIDQQKAGGQDTGNAQNQLNNLTSLITSIGAIIASIVALIMALIAGDFAGAATIFMTIIGQLAQTLASILNVQINLQSMIGSLGGGGHIGT